MQTYTFLITGAASGIGAGIAAQLAEAGHHVIVSDLNREAAETALRFIVDGSLRLAPLVTHELNFEHYVDYGFTADMEQKLDDIASGQQDLVATYEDIAAAPTCWPSLTSSGRTVVGSGRSWSGSAFGRSPATGLARCCSSGRAT